MAFCNSCGTAVNPGTRFCNKCGAPIVASSPAPAQPVVSAPVPVPVAAVPAPAGNSSALKIILIVLAVIVGIGIIGVAGVSFFVYRVAKSVHTTQNGDNVKIETPFGNLDTSKDPIKIAKDLGVDIYPSATVQKNGSATVNIGAMHSVTAAFESSDSLDKVCAFYKTKFPNAMTSTSDQDHCTIVASDQKNMITINIEANEGGSKFQIASVSKKLTN
jgi:hypothetical protein